MATATKTRPKEENGNDHLEPPTFSSTEISVSMAETSKNLFMSECISVLGIEMKPPFDM